MLDGDDEGAATDDSELAAYAEIAALAKSGAPEEELHAFIRRRFQLKKIKEVAREGQLQTGSAQLPTGSAQPAAKQTRLVPTA